MATSAIDTIKNYLDARAKDDPQFAVCYAKENKNIKDCYAYIISEARKQATGNVCCMSDDEVFGLAVHYYDEDNLDMSGAKKERRSAGVKVVRSDSEKTKHKTGIKDKSPKASDPKSETIKKAKAKKEPKPVRKLVQLSLFDFD